MKKTLFRGCATALVTPFSIDGIDEAAFRNLIRFQLNNGINALVACGTTGEPSTMTEDEWLKTIEITVDEVNGRVPVIAGTGGNNTQHVISCAKLAKKAGADAQLCVTPYYNKTTQKGLIAHYTAIADNTDLPIIAYNVPSRTGLSVQAETLAALSTHENIIAMKEASADFVLLGDMMRLCKDRIDFYSGSDEVIVPLMAMGGIGVISVLSNIAPAQTVALCDAMAQGRVAEAAALQLKLLPLIHAIFSEVNPIPIKAALSMMGLCDNRLRLPLIPLSENNAKTLEQAMKALGLLA